MNNNVKVRIFKPHTHAGVKHVPGPEGKEIEVPAHDAAWLKEQGLLERPSNKPAADAKPAG